MNMDAIVQLLGFNERDETLRANAHIWHDALAAIANKTMDVDAASTLGHVTLLHLACYHGKIDVVRQLLALHANPSAETKCVKYRPMHYAAMSGLRNAVEICKLLPVADLAHTNKDNQTPLIAALLHVQMDTDLLQWMIQQPQWDVLENYATIIHCIQCQEHPETDIPVVDAEVAARKKRWTAARAAWCVACTACL